MDFDGTADYTLDAKNRLTVPPRFRASLAGGVVLAKGMEPCVGIWPPGAYESFRRDVLRNVHPMSDRGQKMKRFFSANSHPADLDGTGRVGLPTFLMEHGGLGREVTVIGAGDHLEVWDRKAWVDYNASLGEEILSIAKDFDEVTAP
jgi:MraZ protein